MPDPEVANKPSHVALLEYVAHETVGLAQMHARAIARDDTRGVLTSMLQRSQRVIQRLVGLGFGNDSDNAAHGFIPSGFG